MLQLLYVYDIIFYCKNITRNISDVSIYIEITCQIGSCKQNLVHPCRFQTICLESAVKRRFQMVHDGSKLILRLQLCLRALHGL